MPEERRKYPRAQLSLRVRLRWPGPLRQVIEVTETLDVSRGGLLVYSADGACPGRRLWLTFPYDSSMLASEPESLAQVLRAERRPAGGHFIALRMQSRPVSFVSLQSPMDRRAAPRSALRLPMAVRAPCCPWPEETMTVDVSMDGICFSTPRVYHPRDVVKVAIRPGIAPASWTAHEVAARVVRITPAPDAAASDDSLAASRNDEFVAIQRIS